MYHHNSHLPTTTLFRSAAFLVLRRRREAMLLAQLLARSEALGRFLEEPCRSCRRTTAVGERTHRDGVNVRSEPNTELITDLYRLRRLRPLPVELDLPAIHCFGCQ